MMVVRPRRDVSLRLSRAVSALRSQQPRDQGASLHATLPPSEAGRCEKETCSCEFSEPPCGRSSLPARWYFCCGGKTGSRTLIKQTAIKARVRIWFVSCG